MIFWQVMTPPSAVISFVRQHTDFHAQCQIFAVCLSIKDISQQTQMSVFTVVHPSAAGCSLTCVYTHSGGKHKAKVKEQ